MEEQVLLRVVHVIRLHCRRRKQAGPEEYVREL